MGLYVHSLDRLPLDVERDYYVYVLDYGWDEPLGDALHANFRRMADLAAKSKAVVVAGTDSRSFAKEILSVHFDDEQFSWNNVNGESGEDILPAILVTTIHPRRFESQQVGRRSVSKGIADERLILIPLRGVCKSSTEVIALIDRIFRDIVAGRPLKDFSIAKEIRAGERGAISDALILRPSIWGVGVDLKDLLTKAAGQFNRRRH